MTHETVSPAPRDGPTVLVFGGGGFYGGFLVADLLHYTPCRVLIAERHPPDRWANDARVQTAVCDIWDRDAVRRLVAESDLVIHCAGPFGSLPLVPAQVSVEYGKPYIDLSEDREFRRHILGLDAEARRSGAILAPGASVVPGQQVLLALLLRPQVDRVDAIRTFAAPDLKRHRGPAMFYTMLVGAGSRFRLPRNGQEVEAHGWTEPERVRFPPPIGNRLVYLVLEMAELDLLPQLFGAGTIEFKAGCEFSALNRMLSGMARLRIATGGPKLERWLVPVRAFCWAIGRFGREEGGFIVEVSGPSGSEYHAHALAVVARYNGGQIPALLAGILAEEILAGRLTTSGVVSPEDWMSPQRLIDAFAQRGLALWQRRDRDEWQPLAMTDQLHGRPTVAEPSLNRYRPWLYAAALYNLIWGALTILFPTAYFRLVRMRRPADLALWQLAGMFVLVYAPAYWWAARRPAQHVHLVLVGFMGKVMGPIGLLWGAATGRVPLRLGLIVLTNDLLWWPSFYLYLRDASRLRGGWRAMLRGE